VRSCVLEDFRDHRRCRGRRKKLTDGLRLHWLRPEDERRDCDFCRKYEHHNFRNPDPEQRGQPIVELGRYRLRGPRDEPQCGICPKRFAWTPENLAVYRRWRFHVQGFDVGQIDEQTAWAFYRLEETAREVQQLMATRSVNRAIVEALGG
jgi:hypothetical protein